MSVFSFSDIETPPLPQFDLVIVGSGPAGLSIAHAFRDTPYQICVLESGGIEPDRKSESLNEIVSVGHRRADPELVRRRCVGGTSAIWSGRCGMFDAVDYQSRSWLKLSGWPIDGGDLEGQIARAGDLLGLPNLSPRHALRDLKQPFDREPWNEELLSPAVWQFSSRGADALIEHFAHDSDDLPNELAILRHSGRKTPVDFGRAHIGWLRESKNVHLLIQTTALEVVTNPSSRSVAGIRVCGPDGENRIIRGSRIVLACGGIDNARLLLASRSAVPVGLGNEHDQVGRYLTDHTFTELGSFSRGQAKALRRRLGPRLYERHGAIHSLCFGLRLSPALQRREGLMNAAAHLVDFGTRLAPLSSIASGLRSLSKGRDVGRAGRQILSGLTQPVALAEGLLDRLVRRRASLNDPDKTILGCVVEQPLNPASRIRLSGRTDRFGLPLPEIDWRIDEAEFRTARRFREIMVAEFQRLGMDPPAAPDWEKLGIEGWRSSLIDLAHPMCTTRMSDDPQTGVVDSNCKVHGVEGLYVAGSSVFATPGHMNPTQMIVALALRLADHLHAALVNERTPSTSVSMRPKVRVGIVGAGDRIRRIYRPALKAAGERIEVVGITSRNHLTAQKLADETGWTAYADPARMLEEGAPDFVLAAVSSDAVDGAYGQLPNLNRPLLLETPFCWSLHAGRKLMRRIKDSQAVVAVGEQFPSMPLAQFQKKVMELGGIGAQRAAVNQFSDYDYHGLARLRSTLDQWDDVISVSARRIFAGENGGAWDDASFDYRSGGVLKHQFCHGNPAPSPPKPRDFQVVGSEGTLTDTALSFPDKKGELQVETIQRIERNGRLQELWLAATPIGPVIWKNPFADHDLDDEQVAVACLLLRMAEAVSHGGSPAYDAADALFDMEMLAAMRASEARNGKKVHIGISVYWEKARKKLLRR